MGPSIVIDDATFPDSDFNGSEWDRNNGENSQFNETLSVCRISSGGRGGSNSNDARRSTPPSFSFSFIGSDVIFYGTLTNGVAMNYTIDQTSFSGAVFSQSIPGTVGAELFKLTGLSKNTSHNLTIFPSAGQFVFDYVTYTPTSSTPLGGSQLILDDQDSLLQYSSGWTKSANRNFNTGVPYLLTTTETSSKGATMSFPFVGSAVAVYGVLQQVNGTFSASFSVDGGSATKFSPFDGSQKVNASSWALSQRFFHQNFAPGNHTLLVSLDDVSGSQVLYIDSVVFEATNATSLSSTTSNESTSHGHKFPTGAVGGILGAVFLLIILFAYLRNRRAQARKLQRNTVGYTLPSTPPPHSDLPLGVYAVPYQDRQTASRPQWTARRESALPPSPAPSENPPSAQDSTLALPEAPLISPWSAPPSVISSASPPPSNQVSGSFAGVLQANEKGLTELQWRPKPTVRNPSPPPPQDGDVTHNNTTNVNVGSHLIRRATDAGPVDYPPAYDPNLYSR